MSDTTTIARPYAKAIFEYARSKNQLRVWSEILHDLAVAVLDIKVKQFLNNPEVTDAQQRDVLTAPFHAGTWSDKATIENLIALLVENKRIMLIPEIHVLYEALRAEQEKILQVNVSSYLELTHAQQEELKTVLSKRVQRQVTLNLTIDKSLLGGAVIYAGDLIIDGSVRGKLNKLNAELAA